MTTKDLYLLYKQEKGIDVPQPVHNLPDVRDYIDWLEDNLVMMTSCVDDLTVSLKKATAVINKYNPQIN